jgi:cytosine/adenosine deaminase-related metal-dependent hydrolase
MAEQLAEMIVRAAGVTQDPASTQPQRQEAVAFLESLKGARRQGAAGAPPGAAPDLTAVVGAAAALTRPDRPLDVQVSAYALLTHAVRHRWDELNEPERAAVGQLAYQHLGDGGF